MTTRTSAHAPAWLAAAGVALALCLARMPAVAQAPNAWDTEARDPQRPDQAPGNITVVPRSSAGSRATNGQGVVSVMAFLTDNSPPLAQGLTWRVYRDKPAPGSKSALVATSKEPSPTLRLEPGSYYINVALGRAYLTRKVAVAGDQVLKERFVLNAGGLRVVPVLASGERADERLISFDVETDDREGRGQRTKVVSGVKAGVVLRLNAGVYSVTSTYGDANAVARAEVPVEAGKLSEVTLTHAAARVSFKLVTREGGEAIADTQWTIANSQGDAVKESSGALPTHLLAPGAYAVRAKHAGRLYKRDFSVRAGDNVLIEVVMP